MTLDSLSVDLLEVELAQHPFGDTIYLTKRLHDSYENRLQTLADRMPIAGSFLECLNRAGPDAWYYAMGNTVVRCAVDHALRAFGPNARPGLSVGECEEVLRAMMGQIESMGDSAVGSEFLDRLERDGLQNAMWSEQSSEDAIMRHFRTLVTDALQIRLCAPDDDERAVFKQGLRLLRELLPEISNSALRHVHAVAVFAAEGPMAGSASSSDINLSGTIFLNRNKLRNPWVVAEHVFHEALHQQLYDFHQGHTMLLPNPVSTHTVCSLWNLPTSIGDNHWGTWRTINAFHVYVHLTLLATVAEQRAVELEQIYGPVASIGRRTANARAHYLGDQLRAVCWDELTKAGKRWVERFGAVLEVIDLSPPPPGADLHLLLDRYWTEAHMVVSLSDRVGSRPGAVQQLVDLVDEEVSCIRLALQDLECQHEVDEFDSAVAVLAGLDPIQRCCKVRTLIVDTILAVSPNGGYTLSEAQIPDRMIKDRIDQSSEVLRTLLER